MIAHTIVFRFLILNKMDTLDALLTLATRIEKQIFDEERSVKEPLEKLTRSVAKQECVIEIYKLIGEVKDND